MPSERSKRNKPVPKASEKAPHAPAGYSKRPLVSKLGMKREVSKAILEAPEGFEDLLGTGNFDTSLDLDSYDYLHFFTASRSALETIFPILAKRLNRGGMLWISWPKKSSGKQTDLDGNAVREIGLATGLVDVKVCAIDKVWSGLKFLHRKGDVSRF